MESALCSSSSPSAFPQGKLASQRIPGTSAPSVSPHSSFSIQTLNLTSTAQRTPCATSVEADLLPAPPSVSERLTAERPSTDEAPSTSSPVDSLSRVHFQSQYRRGMTGPKRSVEVLGGDMVAFGRTVLTGVPEAVTAAVCACHEGPAAAQTQGAFIGMKNMQASSRHVFSLGTLRGVRFLSCFRFKLWWMTQRVGTCGHEVPYETQFLLLECPPLPRGTAQGSQVDAPSGSQSGGRRPPRSNQAVLDSDPVYVVMLPVLEGAFRSSLQGGPQDQLEACVESGAPSVMTTDAQEAVYVHAGHNPFRTISEAVRAVEAHSGSFTRRELKTMPGLLDHFGWCTWDAFYTDVTAQGVNQGLESLGQGGTPAKFLIIDDGWQSVADDPESKNRGVVTAGTQYASRLTCVRENQKFKASSSFKRSGGGAGAGEGNGAGAGAGAGAATRVSAEGAEEAASRQANGHAKERGTGGTGVNAGGGLANGHAVAEAEDAPPAAAGGAQAVQPPAAEAAAEAALAAEESRLAGLGDLVQQVKAAHSVKFVYVWHALLGYWGGVNPGPKGGMERFEPHLIFPEPSHGVLANQPDMAEDTLTLNGLGLVPPGKAFYFYDELHSYLAGCGVDGVKVDVQNILETLGAGHGGRVALARQYHSALETSIRKNFRDNGIISCMSHNTDALYLAKHTAVMRASDDFWPTDPASHTVHIISVAYNSLFLGEFMQPDWDMFQSLHPAAEFHGADRAAGGCAVYVSDKPGRHDFGVLRKLVLEDGTILRAKLPGRPTRDCLFVDPARDAKSLLKIWNMNACNGIVAAFNCQGAAWCREGRKYRVHNPERGSVTGVVAADDIDALDTVAPSDWNGDVVVYSHFSDELVTLPANTSLVVTLPPLQCEVFTMAPLKVLGGIQFAPIGFGRMYNAGGAVLSCNYFESGPSTSALALAQAPVLDPASAPASTSTASSSEGVGSAPGHTAGWQVSLAVRGGGQLLAHSSQAPREVRIKGSPVPFEFSAADGRVTVPLGFSQLPVPVDFLL